MCLNPSIIKYRENPLIVPCGKCVECKSLRTDEWTSRIILESRQHKQNCFISLTYNDANIPEGNTLSKPDYQKFLKRLRFHLGRSAIRYFGCGEYGSEEFTSRPHYHFIIFGWCPDDLVYFFTDNNGFKIYKSKFLEKIWGKGFVTVGTTLNERTVKYVSKYMQKLPENDSVVKPFITMSNRPGIGYCAVKESMLKDPHLYLNGKVKPLPRYFKKVLSRLFPNEYEEFAKSNLDKYIKLCQDSVTFVYSQVPLVKYTRRIIAKDIYKIVDPSYTLNSNQFTTVFYEESEFYKKLTKRRKKILSSKIGKCIDKFFCLDYNLYKTANVRKT